MDEFEVPEGYDRVTHILNPFTSYSKIDPAVLENAARRGKSVHTAIQDTLMDIPRDETFENKGYLYSFEKFWTDHNAPIAALEKRINDGEIFVSGQCDLIIEKPSYSDEGDHVLIDWKTSVAPQKTYGMQAAAYTYLAEKEGFKIYQCWFVSLDKKGKEPTIRIYQKNELREYWRLFLNCLEIYRMFFKDQKLPTFDD